MADPQPVKVPPTFKTLLPFIRRAEELDRDTSRPESKLIAYFCRQYAMELGIKLRENDESDEATGYLLSLMDRLEDEKKKLPEFTEEEGKEICEDFAMEIFSKADDEDRAGMANKSTARTFYAAGTFFDILNQFGDISENVVEKRRYCKYKAATILKAIKEGKTPEPGPPEGLDMKNENDASDDVSASIPSAPEPSVTNVQADPAPFPSLTESMRSAGAMSASELDNTWRGPASTPMQQQHQPSAPSHSAPAAPPAPTYTPVAPPTPAYHPPSDPAPPAPTHTPVAPTYQPPSAPAPAYEPSSAPAPAYEQPAAPTPAYQPTSNYTPQSVPSRARNTPVSQNEINDAIEYAKFAIAALKVKDMKLAQERLEMALRNIR